MHGSRRSIRLAILAARRHADTCREMANVALCVRILFEFFFTFKNKIYRETSVEVSKLQKVTKYQDKQAKEDCEIDMLDTYHIHITYEQDTPRIVQYPFHLSLMNKLFCIIFKKFCIIFKAKVTQ